MLFTYLVTVSHSESLIYRSEQNWNEWLQGTEYLENLIRAGFECTTYGGMFAQESALKWFSSQKLRSMAETINKK